MTKLFQAYLACSLGMAAVTLLLFALSPLLGRWYRAKSMYAAWLAVMLGFLVPLGSLAAQPRLTARIPSALMLPMYARENADASAIPTGGTPLVNDALLSQSTGQPDTATHDAPANALGIANGVGNQSASNSMVEAEETSAGMHQTEIKSLESANAPTAMPAAPLPKPLTWLDLLALAWVLGAAVTLAIQFTRHALFLRTVRRWQDEIANEATLRILAREKQRLHIRQGVRLMLCPSVSSPMMIGLFKARLLLPDEELTGEELALVFRHELTHLKRRDLWVKAALMLAVALHWFNPAAYLMAKSLGFWQESSCDESVTAADTQEEKQFYSETIIRVIRRQARTRSLVTTSFYGGRNGMKRRILSILESGGKRVGAMVGVMTLACVIAVGMAFAIEIAPSNDQLEAEPLIAYVTGVETDGAPMLTQPTANDLDVPLAAYFAGTPVTIIEKRASSALDEWGYQDGEVNWARVLVGGDGEYTGVSGWIPLRYLTATPHALPTATLATDSPTGHVNLYVINDDEAKLLGVYGAGTRVTLLGRVQKWYQIELEGRYGFVAKENLVMDGFVQARYDTFRPYRFDTYDRTAFERDGAFWEMYYQKSSEYGGLDMEYWSLEDKAWYGQMENAFGMGHDKYYQLPQEGDLQKDEAVSIAWNAFRTRCKLPEAKQEDYSFNLGFYSVTAMDEERKEWSVIITRKGGDAEYAVKLSSPSGAIQQTTDASRYLAASEGEADRATQNNALAEWEEERGEYQYWPLEDKAVFSAQYGDGLTVLPDELSIPQERAEELALNELLIKYDIPAKDAQALKLGVEYLQENGAQPYWLITFYDAQDNYLARVALAAHTGEILNSENPIAPSNG